MCCEVIGGTVYWWRSQLFLDYFFLQSNRSSDRNNLRFNRCTKSVHVIIFFDFFLTWISQRCHWFSVLTTTPVSYQKFQKRFHTQYVMSKVGTQPAIWKMRIGGTRGCCGKVFFRQSREYGTDLQILREFGLNGHSRSGIQGKDSLKEWMNQNELKSILCFEFCPVQVRMLLFIIICLNI